MLGHSPISDHAHQHVEVVYKHVKSLVMAEQILLESMMNCATLAINRTKVRNAGREHVQLIGKRVHLVNVQHHAETMELKREPLLAKKYWKVGKF